MFDYVCVQCVGFVFVVCMSRLKNVFVICVYDLRSYVCIFVGQGRRQPPDSHPVSNAQDGSKQIGACNGRTIQALIIESNASSWRLKLDVSLSKEKTSENRCGERPRVLQLLQFEEAQALEYVAHHRLSLQAPLSSCSCSTRKGAKVRRMRSIRPV